MPGKVRIDKWLWSVRIFKTRTQANDACRSNKVKINGSPLKPKYLLSRQEFVQVYKNGFNLEFEVVDVLNHYLIVSCCVLR